MQKYFFHFMQGEYVLSDDEGTPCNDRQQALDVANAAASELNLDSQYDGGEVVVFDEGGTEIGRVPICTVQ